MSWASWDDSGGGGGGTATQSKGAAGSSQKRRGLFGTGSGGWNLGFREPTAVAGSGTGYPNAQYPTTYPVATSPALQANAKPPPPAPPFGSPGWENTTGLQFNEYGQAYNPATGGYHSVQMPEWAGDDPAGYYALISSVPEAYRAAFIANMQSKYDTDQQNEAALGRGRAALTGQMQDVDAAAGRWATDPYRNLVQQGLMTRASPEYQFITPEQRTAYEDPLRQGYAMADINQRGAAAGHGTSQGGNAIGSNQALAVQAQTGGNQLRAQIDADEQRLKSEALSALAGTTSAYNAADTQYVNAGNQLAGALASLESGVHYEPTDYTVWPALNDATNRANDEADFRNRSLDDAEQKSKYGWDDLTETILSMIGSGVPEAVMGALF